MASTDSKRKKKHKSNRKQSKAAPEAPATKPPISHQPKRTPETHQQALDLSHQLRQLSSQKRLRECLALYNSSQNDHIRDAHHGSVVIDCCARCGEMDEAERVVTSMLGTDVTKDQYIWEKYDHIPYKRMPIQAWTALLKGYVHGGLMAKADSLFMALCGNAAADVNDGSSKKRKRVETNHGDRANVRTLNTLLRGCLWSAATLNEDAKTEPKKKKAKGHGFRHEIVGGIVTAERAWDKFDTTTPGNNSFDSSSYEYFITLFCQALQCEKAELQLKKMKEQFNLINDLSNADPSLVESLVVCLVALSRAYALLGRMKDVQRCTKETLELIQHIESHNPSETGPAKKKPKIATGGKQAWKSNMDNDGSGRREQSNTLFRSHRISELKIEATALSQYSSGNKGSETLAKIMMTRLLYFSGGGTTGLNAIAEMNSASNTDAESSTQQTLLQCYNSLWFSFGLKAAADKNGISGIDMNARTALPQDMCNRLRNKLLGKDQHVITSNGYIDFKTVFSAPLGSNTAPLHIELGSGSGDWAVIQAQSNPSENYVTVELRADRVAQTFAKVALHNPTRLENLCSVGSECGSFLKDRIQPESIRTIFVNHPEPPTQTSTSDDEQAHMLNSEAILAAAKCLEPDGKGRLVIVTDNLIYAKLIGSTVAKVLREANLSGVKPNEVGDLRKIETSSDPNTYGAFVHVYEGKPSASIGHYTPKSNSGTSYFDRLWRTGAGKHADMKRRYIIAARTVGDQYETQDTSNKAAKSSKTISNAAPNKGKPGKNKRSAEKQQRRNERRLLKKQQQQQS